MVALRELFTTDIGLLSLLVIVFVIGMGGWLYWFVGARIKEDAAAASRAVPAARRAP